MNQIRKTTFLALVLYLSFTLFPDFAWTADRLKVAVVNYPLKYFTERIGGDAVEVIFKTPKKIDPAFWMPNITAIGVYQSADLIILNGANYASWINKVALPRLRMVDSSKSFTDKYITLKQLNTHSHGPRGEHSHKGLAFTTWLDFSLSVEQSNAVLRALQRKIPVSNTPFKNNHAKLVKDLNQLDQTLMDLANILPNKIFIASHPVYQYLARRYGLKIKSVLWEPDRMPADEQWEELNSILKTHPGKWMIWESQPMDEIVQKLKSVGIEVLVFNPAANTPPQGDYLDIMRANINNLHRAFRQ